MRRHNSQTLNWCANKLRGSGQSGLVPVENRKGATVNEKETVKYRWAEHFEIVLNRDRVAGKDIDKNERVCNSLDMKEDLFQKD